MNTDKLLADLDKLDIDTIELPQDASFESLATGHAVTEIGASCPGCIRTKLGSLVV
ncbi:thiomuracin/GE37468 family thiazolyl RiPP peptide [Streptomyces sp. NPDC048442]|uniref:thiomuracin/GE37468 family thiazolyl RiPP peptide n=1 Tax=Streptomyces sp. NPDC048442 TaxID=3154823 RepID=UPI00341D4CC6